MKATIEIDATPQEMRALLGLPDVEALQQEVLEKIRAKTLAGIEANSPEELMKKFMPTADQFKSMEALQASFWQAFAGHAEAPDKDEEVNANKGEK
jgi:hypothetical protein